LHVDTLGGYGVDIRLTKGATVTTASHTAEYTVSGMTCAHCVASVTEEVQELDGVTSVEVDLATGVLTVSTDRSLDDAEIAAAVDDAGYALA